MSIDCMMTVWGSSKSSGNDRLILLAIADEADDEGRNAYPSMRRLAAKANCHLDTVVEVIKRLEASGELEVNRPERQGRGRFNRYRVKLQRVGKSDPLDSGSVEGSVEGSVRMGPNQSRGKSEPKRDPIRTKDQSGARFPQPRQGCEECANGWREDDQGNAVACSCEGLVVG